MAKMNPYLNFDGKAEEAFNFYKSVFGSFKDKNGICWMVNFDVNHPVDI